MANKKIKGTPAHPGHISVPLQGGQIIGKVRPWTMANRAELKPLVEALLEKISSFNSMEDLNLGKFFSEAEEELAQVARASLELPAGAEWDKLHWEDLPNIIQAVWEMNIMRADGGGLGGKALRVLAETMSGAMREAAKNQGSGQKKSNTTGKGGNSKGSPSSPVDGEQTQSDSVTH